MTLLSPANPPSRNPYLIALVVVAATAGYAGSFFMVAEARPQFPRLAAMISVAAALSWPTFGLFLLAMDERKATRRGVLRWGDLCLRTMLRGNAVLGASILLNVILAFAGAPLTVAVIAAHAGILLAANVTMASFFVTQSAQLGVPRRSAIFAWLGGLNLPFLLILTALWNFT